MFALSDSQLRTIWKAAERGVYLERMIAWLHFRGGRFIDRDLDDAVRLALRGLIHEVGGLTFLSADLDLNQIVKSCDLFSWLRVGQA